MDLVLAVLIGMAIGLALGALGGGGSILTVPALVFVLGESGQDATTASLVIVGVSSAIAAVSYARERQVRWSSGLLFAAAGAVATYAGSHLNRMVPEPVLLVSFAGLMTVAGAVMIIKNRRRPIPATAPATRPLVAVGRSGASPGPPATGPVHTAHRRRRSRWIQPLHLIAAGLLIGFLTGFLGVGGGFLIVPMLTLVFGYRMKVATGTSLLIISLNSAIALLFRAGHQSFDWHVIIPVTVSAISGSLLGKRIASRIPHRVLGLAFGVLMIAVGGYMAFRAFSG
ncbi:MAG TPA: sulfite exporter TauE/SafE family protein [Microlunatus sp.]|nr:sulfite exporter TauE/SafE family protein [Microlunatus sp.]